MKPIKRDHELHAHDPGASTRLDGANSADPSHVVARLRPAEEARPADGFDLSNVVAFTRHRPQAVALPLGSHIHVTSDERPVPAHAERHRALQWMALLLISLAAHVCLYLPFGREPPPMTSLGEISVSVELVLGAQTPAGLAAQPGAAETPTPPLPQAQEPVVEPAKPESETPRMEVLQAEPTPTEPPPPVTEPSPTPTEPPAPVDEPPPADPQPTEPPPAETPPPVTEPPPPPMEPPAPAEEPTPPAPPVQMQQTGAQPETPPEILTLAPTVPPEVQPSPPAPTIAVAPSTPTTTPARAKPAPRKPETARPPAPDRREAEPRNAARRDRSESRSGSLAANAASGVGPGRSEVNTNYRGIVAAHLARHKQFPPEARDRGSQGSAVVTFALNGGGRVTSVSLSRGTGVAALDQEAVAMVRRASPFPPSPDGRSMSFTVPVSFRLQ